MRTIKYSSEKLRERKARILKEARSIIGEKGLDGFNMRDLAARSEVALATLYNNYGSKDALIGLAVNDFFEPIVEESVAGNKGKSPLNRLMALLDNMAAFVIESPAYTRVVMSLYYKPKPETDIHRRLYNLAFSELSDCISAMRQSDNFYDWVSTELVADDMSEHIMVRINQWCREDISNEAFSSILKHSVLQILVGATKGSLHTAIVKQLKSLTPRRLRLIDSTIGVAPST